jgi:hypothetical protein
MSAATFLAMNPWAILVGVLASFFVSFVWYGLVFQKAWLAALGISAADLEDMRLGKTTPFVVAGLTYAVLGVVTGLFVVALDVRTPTAGAMLGLLTFVGFNMSAFVRLIFFEDRPVRLVFIDGGADLATHLVFGLVLSLWR